MQIMTENMSEGFVRSGGVNIWTIRTGEESPAVMLCNGGAGGCDYLPPATEMLATERRARLRNFAGDIKNKESGKSEITRLP